MAWLKKLALLAVLATPGVASAAQMQYIVYNAFDETVQAFQRLALITGDSVFLMLAGCFVAGSIVMSASFFAAEGMAKKANNPFGFLIQAGAGLALFFGAVMPKGTIYVYDQVLNKNQAVGGIPDLIVFFAGGMNAVERELTRMVDTAAATPYSNDVGAIGYQLIYNASRAKQSDADLERTIGQYVLDCGLTAVGTNQNGATLNELLRTSPDLRDTLAKFTHPSWPTTYYPSNNSAGVPGTCADSWNYIRPFLDNVTTGPVGEMKKLSCQEAGFNMADAAAAAKCESVFTEAANHFGSLPASSGVFLRNFIIKNGMQEMLMRPDFTASQGMLVGRNMMAEGFGATEALNQWVPRLRAMMLALVLGILPIPLLFIATNLVYKSLGMVIGLMAFMALWGVTDAISVQMARDAAAAAFTSIKQQHVGFESLMLAPTASMQALALYGKYRMMAMGMATLIAGGLFKVSTGAFGSSAEAAGKDLAVEGGSAGRSTMTPEGMSSTMGSLNSSMDVMSQVSTVGPTMASSASAAPGLHQARGQAAYIDAATQIGGRPGEALDSLMATGGAAEGGGRAGKAIGLSEAARERGGSPLDTAVASASGETQLGIGGNIGGHQGAKDLAKHRGTSVQDVTAAVAGASRAFEGESALSRRDAGRELTGKPDGDLDVANIAGTTSAASPIADANTAAVFEGDNRTEQLGALAQARNASTKGLGGAAGGDVDRIEALYKTEHTTGLAKAATIGGKAGAVGVGQGRDAIIGAEGTNRAAAAVGLRALEDGNTLGKVSTAQGGVEARKHGGAEVAGKEIGKGTFTGNLASARATNEVAGAVGVDGIAKGEALNKFAAAAGGAAAEQAGGVHAAGNKIGTQRLASDLGAATAREAAARQIVGDGVANRVRFESLSSGNMQAVLTGPELGNYLENAVKNGMPEKHAESIRRAGAARVEFGFDADKGIVQATASGTFKTFTGSFASDENGQMQSYRDDQTVSHTSTRAYGPQVSGSAALFNDKGSLASEVSRAYGGNIIAGEKDGASFDTLAAALGKGMEDRGFRADASNRDNKAYSWNASLSGGLGVGSTRMGVGVGAGVAATGGTTDDTSVSNNLNTAAFRQAISESRAQAVAEWSHGHPGQPPQGGDPIADRVIAERTAELIQERAAGIERTATRVTGDAREGNDAMGGDAPRQGSYNEPPPSKSAPSGTSDPGPAYDFRSK